MDVLIPWRRNAQAAKRLLRKLLKKQGYAPKAMVTDKLRSFTAAIKSLGLGCEHRQHKGLKNRAENLCEHRQHKGLKNRAENLYQWLEIGA